MAACTSRRTAAVRLRLPCPPRWPRRVFWLRFVPRFHSNPSRPREIPTWLGTPRSHPPRPPARFAVCGSSGIKSTTVSPHSRPRRRRAQPGSPSPTLAPVGPARRCKTWRSTSRSRTLPHLCAGAESGWDASASLTCLEDLGFSAACAQTWLYNVKNTRRHCFSVCIVELDHG